VQREKEKQSVSPPRRGLAFTDGKEILRKRRCTLSITIFDSFISGVAARNKKGAGNIDGALL
jgi:hypothetical protein